MSASLWFMTPDFPEPVGGVLTIYRIVDDLVASGLAATVVHEERGFRCRWFDNATPVTWLEDVVLGDGDVLVAPEIAVGAVAALASGAPVLVLNQAAYLTFQGAGLPPAPAPVALPEGAVGIVTFSEDNYDYLTLAFPETTVERVHLGVDTSVFRPLDGGKERAIAYMPRKRHDDVVQVLRIMERRGALEGWRLYPIDRLSRAAVAEVLGRSAVFLCFNEQEGFGLPPVEAMASGCVVVGFPGRGGREYLREDTGYPVQDGAIADFVRTAEGVLKAWDAGERFGELTARAASFVASEYSPERQRTDVVRAFSGALERAAGRTPSSRRLRLPQA